MSILDDAIREHLELKRAHGADESELKRLEDEAFGPAERPGPAEETIDPFAEAPTEFLTAPGAGAESGRRVPNIADLQEPPPPKPAGGEAPSEESSTGESATGGADLTASGDAAVASPEPASDGEGAIAQPAPDDRPAAAGDQLRPDPDAPGGQELGEERQAIAEQPTQMFDVEQQLFEDTAGSASPSDEQLIDAERAEPRITPSPADEEPADEFDDFFSDQRLSDELTNALDAPLDDEPDLGLPSTEEALVGIPPLPSEVEEQPVAEEPPAAEQPLPADDTPSPFLDPDAELGPPPAGEPEPPLDHTVEQRLPESPADEGGDAGDTEDEYKPHEPGHVDALEDTPEFLEDAPEDEDAWFEQKPPKDFDFGD